MISSKIYWMKDFDFWFSKFFEDALSILIVNGGQNFFIEIHVFNFFKNKKSV